ncbi:peptide-methionine (S)-S-oxide reductase MsrA [Telluribacter sp.]|uniref:peptide-methionine (S)-S-oxide reductase MsrA n=1 Tax=Telluribacter sp. TaxID=1978767 RepID=UPI002E107366|nr:peptide-methionine (S)-S-oxide reductase MsrA [Telluribacter sp.]
MKTTLRFFTLVLLSFITVVSYAQSTKNQQKKMNNEPTSSAAGLQTATFGTGCFWCTEAVFESLNGVYNVVSGYSGGQIPNPTYKAVCEGTTGHAECVQLNYDPAKISYADLLEAFFRSHDPTTLNRQGNDVGTQYRSVIYYHNDEQKQLAEQAKRELDKSGAFGKPIVTEVSPTEKFYTAEAYHQNYFANNPEQGYCAFVVAPKLDKFRKVFKDKLKKELTN